MKDIDLNRVIIILFQSDVNHFNHLARALCFRGKSLIGKIRSSSPNGNHPNIEDYLTNAKTSTDLGKSEAIWNIADRSVDEITNWRTGKVV